jgi:hypothetical protein
MSLTNSIKRSSVTRRGKGVIRVLLLLSAAAVVAGIAAAFGIARDYGYLRASILTGSADGQYHALATRLAHRAKEEHGALAVIATAGSVENVKRLSARHGGCDEMFALVQDGTPVPSEARLVLVGRLPRPESLLLLARTGHTFDLLANLRDASIGIGPEGSGTAYLMRQLFQDPDLQALQIHLSNHELAEQAQFVAQGKLDLAAFVMQDDAEFLSTIIRQYSLDLVAPLDLDGLVARFPWLTVSHMPSGRYDLLRPIPKVDKQVIQLKTLLLASPCAQRADRIALLMLVAAELPGFVRDNPPTSTAPATVAPLAPEAHQFFLTGEPGFADRYFPWLVNLMSPAYWVYLVMATTVLFNMMTGYSRFRLWRIDAAREKIETRLRELFETASTHRQMRAVPVGRLMREPEKRAAAEGMLERLRSLRAHCQRQANSLVTPMGDEMFYRYQQFLIDEATTTVTHLLGRADLS